MTSAGVLALCANASSPLLERFPGLRGRLPWLPIGSFPTPIDPLPVLSGLPDGTLFVKRDDLTSSLYGGNKVRKLEHLIADALVTGRRTLLTVGGLGSHHALATALHGRRLGLEVDLCLFDQPITPHVIDILRADVQAGARVDYGGGYLFTALRTARAWLRRWREGRLPRFIPPGGATPLGNVGFVSAGLELASQVEQGLLPRPDRIFIASGSGGSVAGLIVGLKLAGLETRCVAVQVASPLVGKRYILRLATRTLELLRDLDERVPRVPVRLDDFDLETGFLGCRYGCVTPEAEGAVAWAGSKLELETTYTGKALAALKKHAQDEGKGEVLLFWNTHSSALLEIAPPEALPPAIRKRIDAVGA